MALIVQNDQGNVAGANGYISVAYFKAYHDDRTGGYGAATDEAIGKAVIKATDYLDTRFSFRGVKAFSATQQLTAWPRYDVVDNDDNWVNGVPEAVKRACAEYALRALTAVLNPDPVTLDDSGLAVKRISKTAGPVVKDIEYADSTTQQLPKYPAADRLLIAAGLVANSNQLARA